jgi:cyclopropane fatty-acyl-phospholipid synthase-like methyltransferase
LIADSRLPQQAMQNDANQHLNRAEALRAWWDSHARQFEDIATLEKDFLDLNPEEQKRLNDFKLWFLQDDAGLVSVLDKDILEFGAGHGRMALEARGYRSYLGVDFSENVVRIGEKRIARAGLSDRARLVASDALAFQGPQEAFDIVCSLGMFCSLSVPTAEAMLRNMVRHLRHGGTLFLDLHHSSPLYDSLRRWKWRHDAEEGSNYDRRVFTKQAILQLLASVGLTDVRIRMREYPFLGMLYAHRNWRWALALRNRLSELPVFDVFGTEFMAIATKP